MKKYLIFIIFILFLLVILLIPKDFKNKDNEIFYEVINEKEVFYVYYVKDNKVIGVPKTCCSLILNPKELFEKSK